MSLLAHSAHAHSLHLKETGSKSAFVNGEMYQGGVPISTYYTRQLWDKAIFHADSCFILIGHTP